MDTRSLICDTPQDISSLNLRLWRVLKVDDRALRSGDLHSIEATFQLVKSSDFLQNLSFPHSLKKLTVVGAKLHWEDVAKKIGILPLLEVLKVDAVSFEGSKWETIEGQFSSLRFLLIDWCDDLEYWIVESSHFPCLEHLEVSLNIGDIPTLRVIELDNCSNSAKEMEEQEELGNEDLA
ncbi:hypothetical protein ACS0TY_012075 [Phlomoides rotata]